MGANPAEGRGGGRGKLYGLYSTSGAVLWQARVEGRPSALHLQRDDRRDSEAALASLVYRHARSAHFMLSYNPFTGLMLDQTAVSLNLSLAFLLPETAPCTLHTAHCTLHTAHCRQHSVHYTLHTTHLDCTLHFLPCTQHTGHCTHTAV